MDNLNVKNQKSSEPFWTDEAGNQTPYSRLFKHERLMEKSSAQLLNGAIKLNTQLADFKKQVDKLCEEVYEQYLQDKKVEKRGKGNFTWYNFDRSIKIEVSVNERITFDEMGIETVKSLLNEFLNENLEAKNQIIKDMVNDAFNTSRGRLDAKKVMNLLRYEGRVKNDKFAKAMVLLKESIRRPSSKTYFRVWAKDNQGNYKNIDLNFSSIEL